MSTLCCIFLTIQYALSYYMDVQCRSSSINHAIWSRSYVLFKCYICTCLFRLKVICCINLQLELTFVAIRMNSFIKSIKKPVRAQNYRHLHFTLTMILMISSERSCICVLHGYRFCIFLRFWYMILELFRQ
jgi:hypothetical protein